MAIYVADFETTTNAEDCRVWAWACVDISNAILENVQLGNTIETFHEFMKTHGGIYYFHNLKFDGGFIIDYLLRNNYTWKKLERTRFGKVTNPLEPGEFTSLISEMGVFYSITIQTQPNIQGISSNIEIRDSLKLITIPVKDMPRTFELDIEKLDLDYKSDREPGHELTEHEKAYISNDVLIPARSINIMLAKGLTKLTAPGCALADFKSRYERNEYRKLFPKIMPSVDKDIRPSYKGGWTYLNPKYKNEQVAEGRVYDVNSMYPWAMKYCLLPYGEPIWFSGEYKPNKIYNLYVINFVAEFKLKPGHYPSIQLKHTMMYAENEYLVKSVLPTVLTLTSVDFELFKENYDYEVIEWIGGYMFKSKHGMFTEYIDEWYNLKRQSKKEHNKGMEYISKLFLNSLYGKFGARLTGKSKIPYLDEEKNCVRYRLSDEEEHTPGYLPVASFITSYCRDKIIRAANACGERFIYADTDSVHIAGDYDPPPGLDVDEYRLGAFKLEEKFIRAKFIRQKTYLEIYIKDGIETMNLKCCGMPKDLKDTIKEEQFYEGAVYDAQENPDFSPKLVHTIVPGGVILKETTFKIKKAHTAEPFVIEGLDPENQKIFVDKSISM